MNPLLNSEGLVQRIASILFPPKLGALDGESSKEYLNRMSRTGVQHAPGVAVGRVHGPAREKRVLLMPGRSY